MTIFIVIYSLEIIVKFAKNKSKFNYIKSNLIKILIKTKLNKVNPYLIKLN